MQNTKRFYQTVEPSKCKDSGKWRILLDGRPVTAQSKKVATHGSHAFVDACAQEWSEQDATIIFADMPFTRLLLGLSDMEESSRSMMSQHVLEYALGDTLCYQVYDDSQLAKAQASIWLQHIDWANKFIGEEWLITHNVMPITQTDALKEAVIKWLSQQSNETLIALYASTPLLASFILSSALILQQIDPKTALDASWLEQDIQMKQWGEDSEAMFIREHALKELQTIESFIKLVSDC